MFYDKNDLVLPASGYSVLACGSLHAAYVNHFACYFYVTHFFGIPATALQASKVVQKIARKYMTSRCLCVCADV